MSMTTTFLRIGFVGTMVLYLFFGAPLIARDDDKKKASKETPYSNSGDENPYLEYRLDFKKGSLEDVLDLAISSDKALFVHTTSKNCNACDYLATSLYTDTKVAAFYNENFVNYIMDVDEVQNVNFARMHDLGSRPMLVYFNAKGEIVRKEDEIADANQLIAAGNNALHLPIRTSSNRANLENMRAKYNLQFRDPDFLYNYAYMLKTFDEPYNAIVNEYIRTQRTSDMQQDKNRKFLYDFTDNLENSAIDYFIRDAGYFKTVMGGKKINDKLKSAIYNSIQTAVKERDITLFEKAKTVLENCNLPNSREFIFYIETQFYEGIRDWDNYVKVTTKYFNDYNVTDPHMLNYAAFKFAHFVEAKNKSAMKNAIKWAKESIRIDYEYYNHLTLALLYYKTEDFKLSEQLALKALKIAEIRNKTYEDNKINKSVDTADASRLIDKLRSRGLLSE
ncbi:MAG: DUF255 domain-containing protein [Chitinophagales bacterium]